MAMPGDRPPRSSRVSVKEPGLTPTPITQSTAAAGRTPPKAPHQSANSAADQACLSAAITIRRSGQDRGISVPPRLRSSAAACDAAIETRAAARFRRCPLISAKPIELVGGEAVEQPVAAGAAQVGLAAAAVGA